MSESKSNAVRERDALATLLVNLMIELDSTDEMTVQDFRKLPAYNAVLRAMGGSVKGAIE